MHFLYANLTVTCYLELGNRGKLLEGYLKRYCLQKSIMYSNIVFMQTCLCVTCYLDLGNRGKLLEGYLKRYCLQKSTCIPIYFITYREVKLQNGKEF
jgi:hypothetical protein